MPHQVLARKWRPRNFQQMVGQEPILRMLINALNQNRLHHAYLFTGTRGVGKTTLGRILAKCLNCETGITATPCGQCNTCQAIDTGRFLDLIEVDAASRTKVEDTREILDNVQYPPTQGRFKIYLIDEVHMLSGHSFNALLKTLEEPPAHVKFILATTDPKKLPITILSRCLQFNLKRVPVVQIQQQLQYILENENIDFEKDALRLIAIAADGSMRDALSILDQAIAYCGDKISIQLAEEMLGSFNQQIIIHLLTLLADQNSKALFTEIEKFAETSADYYQVMDEMLTTLHQINVLQIVGELNDAHPDLKNLSERFSAEEVQLYYQIALIGKRDLPFAPNPQFGFEMTMLRMLAFKPKESKTPIVNECKIEPVKNEPLMSNAPENKPTAPIATSDWNNILPQLKISGMALALASNCTLAEMTDKKISLSLSTTHEPMLNPKLSERIESALSEYLKKPIQLTIKLTSAEIYTPAKKEQQEKDSRREAAKVAIQNDSQVKQMMDIFGATIDEKSVKDSL